MNGMQWIATSLVDAGVLFRDICLPIVLLIGTGWLMDRKFRFDLVSLIKLNIYLFVPAFIFVQVTESSLGGAMAGKVVLFTLSVVACMCLFSWGVARMLGEDAASRKALQLSTMFYNSGNWGLPLLTLAYPGIGPFLQVFVLMTMNVSTFTIGLVLAQSQNPVAPRGRFRQFLPVLRQPAIYGISLAWLAKGLHVPVQEIGFLWRPLEYLSAGFIGIALITLGVQLSKTRPPRIRGKLGWGLAIRLLGGPLAAILLTWVFSFHGVAACVLILGAASPTAVNTALLAHEFHADSRFAAAVVFYSTLLSVLSVTFLLVILKNGLIPWTR